MTENAVTQNGGFFLTLNQEHQIVNNEENSLSNLDGYVQPSPDFLNWQISQKLFIDKVLIGEEEKISMDISVPGFPELVSLPRLQIWMKALQHLYGLSKYFTVQELVPSPQTRYLTESELVMKGKGSLRLLSDEVQWSPAYFKVKENREQMEIYAKHSGYLALRENEFLLLEPLITNTKKTAMSFQFFPVRTGKSDLLNHYFHALNGHKEKFPEALVLEERDPELFKETLPPDHKRSVLFCDGEDPEEGKDARLILEKIFDNADAEKSDRIDFKEQKSYTVVQKGDLLARKTKAIKGQDGLDIYGKTLPVNKGKDLKVTLKGPIETEETEKHILYRSKIMGLLTVQGTTLTLEESFVVKGNVDYSTGNVDYKGSVIIKGDVLSGFKVHSDKTITIMGGVEEGASVNSKESISIGKGVFGKKTRICANESISASFVHEACLYAQKNIYIGKYASHAKMIADGKIHVEGKGVKTDNSTALFGGETYGFQEVVTHSAGSEHCVTRISAGFSPVKEQQKEQLETNINIINRQISTLSSNVPAYVFRKEWNRIKLLPEKKKAEIKELVTRIKQYYTTKKEMEKKLFELNGTIYAADPEKLKIVINNTMKGDVSIMLKGYVHNQSVTKKRVCYTLADDNTIKEKPL